MSDNNFNIFSDLILPIISCIVLVLFGREMLGLGNDIFITSFTFFTCGLILGMKVNKLITNIVVVKK